MSVQANNWYSQNAARGYPLDDAASGVDDTGEEMPDDLLVDLAVSWAIDREGEPFVSAVTAAGVVTITVAVVTGGQTTLLAVATAAPTPYTQVALEAVGDDGETGHVVFGPGVVRAGVYRFSTPAQSRLAARCLRLYRAAGVRSLNKDGVAFTTRGLIRVVAGSDLVVSVDTREVDGVDRTGLVIGLDDAGSTADLFERYAGKCGRRPESGNCTVPPVELIRAVGPDCSGDLTLAFTSPLSAVTEPGVITVSLGVELEDTCRRNLPDADGNLPGFSDPDNPVDPDPPPFPDPDPGPEPPPIDVSSVAGDCSDLPHCEAVGYGLWQEASGVWETVLDDRPGCPGGSSSSSVGAESVRRCTPYPGRGLSLWYDCAYEDTADKAIELTVRSSGTASAGLVFAYYQNPSSGLDNYFTAGIDLAEGRAHIRRWMGTGYLTYAVSGLLALQTDVWYRLRLERNGGPDGLQTFTLTVGEHDGPNLVTVAAQTISGPLTDRAGVICQYAVTDFGYFLMENLP